MINYSCLDTDYSTDYSPNYSTDYVHYHHSYRY